MIDEANEMMVERARGYALGCGLDIKEMEANGLRAVMIYDELKEVRVMLTEPDMFMITQRGGKYLLGELTWDASGSDVPFPGDFEPRLEMLEFAKGWAAYRLHLAEVKGMLLPSWEKLDEEIREAFCAAVFAATEGKS